MAKWYQQCHSTEEAYRQLITTVSVKVNSLDELKFQCHDYIGRGALQKIDTVLRLFEVLEERDMVCVEEVDFLVSILNNIRRKDLVKMVNEYIQFWLQRPPTTSNYSYQTYKSDGVKFVSSDGIDNSSKAFSGFTNSNSTLGLNPVCAVPFANEETPELPEMNIMQHQPEIHFEDTNSVIPEPLRTLIEFLSEQLAHNWQTVMRNLYIPERVIQASTANWSHNIRRQVKETLEYWARFYKFSFNSPLI